MSSSASWSASSLLGGCQERVTAVSPEPSTARTIHWSPSTMILTTRLPMPNLPLSQCLTCRSTQRSYARTKPRINREQGSRPLRINKPGLCQQVAFYVAFYVNTKGTRP